MDRRYFKSLYKTLFKTISCLLMALSLLIADIDARGSLVLAEETPEATVNYVISQFENGLCHTSADVLSYDIDMTGHPLVKDTSEGSAWKRIFQYINERVYTSYKLDAMRNYKKPFVYYVDRVQIVYKDKNETAVTSIRIIFNKLTALDETTISTNVSTITNRFNAILRDAKAAGAISDMEAALLVHDAMARELDVDYSNKTADSGYITTDWGVLLKGKGISSGYAYVFKDCMNELGIECSVIYSESKNNYWNQVCLDGKWYYVDVFSDDYLGSKTFYNDVDEDSSNDGYVSHKYFAKNSSDMSSLGYKNGSVVTKMYDVNSNLGIAESTVESATGWFTSVNGSLAFLNGNWFVVNSANPTTSILKTDFSGTNKRTIVTNYPVMYIQSDGSYLYYESTSKIIRMDENGTDFRTGIQTQEGEKFTELACKNGKLVYTILKDGKTTTFDVNPASVNWLVEGCQHNYQPTVVEATCTSRGYTKYKCSICGFEYLDENSYTGLASHTGGVATCSLKAVCTVCNTAYGELNPSMHIGSETIKNASEATCTKKGYTGDTVCVSCGAVKSAGREIPINPNNHSEKRVVVGKKDASCIEMGYSGDEQCFDCHSVVNRGSSIPCTPHSGGQATCSSLAVCQTCGQPYGLLSPTRHVNTTVRNVSLATCELDGNTGDTFCNDCNQIVAYGTLIPKKGHDYVANVTRPACATQGFTTYICSRCGDSYVDQASITPAVGHTGGTATCIKKAECAVCHMEYGEVNSNNHENTEMRNVVLPTCTNAGYSGDCYCTDCNALVYSGSSVPELGHDYMPEVTVPTCVDRGYTTYVCSRCGDSYIDPSSYVDALGHTGGIATCVSKARCERCNLLYGMADADNHSYRDMVYQPTCITQGYTEHICNDCGDSYMSDITPIGGHGGGTATCVNKAVCSTCGVEYGELDSDNHVHIEIRDSRSTSCSVAGYTGDTYCKDCDSLVSSGTEIAKTAHDFENKVVESTCTERGYTIRTCKTCGEIRHEYYTEPFGHNFTTRVIPASSDNEDEGRVEIVCSRCELIESSTPVDYAKGITLATTSYTYNGTKRKPKVSVVDSKGVLIPSSNYMVTYGNNLNVGRAVVVVTMKGKYSGIFRKYFTIKPKPTTITSVSGMTKGLRVNWKKQTAQLNGYELQYSTSASFTSGVAKTIKMTKGYKTKKISNLTSNKKYYVRIRTYAIINEDGESVKYYSDWSAVKNAKVK